MTTANEVKFFATHTNKCCKIQRAYVFTDEADAIEECEDGDSGYCEMTVAEAIKDATDANGKRILWALESSDIPRTEAEQNEINRILGI